jgi:hypothetical protein
MTAFVVVLGKQWLITYMAVGTRGTLEQRCLERQRKFLGLQKWRLETVMQVFLPLLLQFALLLFAVALSIYLWTINHAIAAIVVSLTTLGVISYVFQVVSAVLSPDSPYQTPLTSFLSNLMLWISDTIPDSWARWPRIDRLLVQVSSLYGRIVYRPRVLPVLAPNTIPSPSPHRRALPDELFGWRFPEPSEAVPAVVWALETSTDPDVVTAAAGMAINLQWPLNLELGIHVSRLLDTFMTCFAVGPGGVKLREGSIDRAIACGQAYGLLKMIHAYRWTIYGVGQMHLGMDKFILPEDGHESLRDIELKGVVYTLQRTPTFPSGLEASPLITWYFRVNASNALPSWSDLQEFLQHFCLERMYKIDASTFADCLFFLNSFFVAWNTRSLVWHEKR